MTSNTPRPGMRRIWPIAIVLALLAGLGGGYTLGSGGMPAMPTDDAADGAAHVHDEETIWTCSMHPQIRQPNPGLCPICRMDLIPATDGPSADVGPRAFRTSPEAAALMNIQTARVERRFVEAQVRMVGKVDYDETRLAYITAWVPGRIERMYADFTGTVVREGDHMVDLYSPELLAAKDELRRATRAAGQISSGAPAVLRETAESTVTAVRSKLRRWGMTDSQIARAEQGTAASDRITIYAPIGGTVIARDGQEGMYVETGMRIYTIADLDKVWVELEAYESDLAWLHFGQTVEFATEAYPGEVFTGTIAFIDPTLDNTTRTVQIRVNVANPGGRLKPGMFVRATVRSRVATGGRVMDPGLAGKWISPMHPEIVKDGPGKCDICGMALVPAEDLGYVPADAKPEDMPLVIPASAPLLTGRRAVVYVEKPDMPQPTYEGREITLGSRAGDYYIVASGLREGERVVTRGNFKIDSAQEIAAKPSMMSLPGGPLIGDDPDDAIAPALRAIVEAYLPMQSALAEDDYAGAADAALRLKEVLDAAPSGPVRLTLGPPAASLLAAEDIETLRIAFGVFSKALLTLAEHHGLGDGDPVYNVYCPMATDFSGGRWLQGDDTVRNPYYGASMFSCGTVEGQLGGEISGHNHDAMKMEEGSGSKDMAHDEGSGSKTMAEGSGSKSGEVSP